MTADTIKVSCPYCEREWETHDKYKYREGDRCPYCGMGHIEITASDSK